MLNIFGKKSDKIMDLADKGLDKLDKLFYTKEEKADFAKANWQAYFEYIKATREENSIRSQTRRILSISVIYVFLLLVILAVVAYYYISVEYAQFIVELIDTKLGNLVMMVAVFYFGPYMLNYIFSKYKKK